MEQKELFEKLYGTDVNSRTEKKNGLTYLSWAWAWAEFKKACPDATYEIVKQENGLPYAYDDNTGYMVYTRVTAAGITHEMWLPVMDYRNKALQVGQASMFDINKAIMRCLTKNLAMFGLGLYIYAGEDLPDCDAPTATASKDIPIMCTICGLEIQGAKKNDKILSPRDIATMTGGRCLSCWKKKEAQKKNERKSGTGCSTKSDANTTECSGYSHEEQALDSRMQEAWFG